MKNEKRHDDDIPDPGFDPFPIDPDGGYLPPEEQFDLNNSDTFGAVIAACIAGISYSYSPAEPMLYPSVVYVVMMAVANIARAVRHARGETVIQIVED